MYGSKIVQGVVIAGTAFVLAVMLPRTAHAAEPVEVEHADAVAEQIRVGDAAHGSLSTPTYSEIGADYHGTGVHHNGAVAVHSETGPLSAQVNSAHARSVTYDGAGPSTRHADAVSTTVGVGDVTDLRIG